MAHPGSTANNAAMEDTERIPYAGGPPVDVLQIWTEVGNGLDKNQTVVWKAAVESLDFSKKHLPDIHARRFVDRYMTQIVGILVDQIPSKIGNYERECVQESLSISIDIVVHDLEEKVNQPTGRPVEPADTALATLEHVWNRKKNYYKPGKSSTAAASWQTSSGMPELRFRLIQKFRQANGFRTLAKYLQTVSKFPSGDFLHHILVALTDALRTNHPNNMAADAAGNASQDSMPELAIIVSSAIMERIHAWTEDDLRQVPVEHLSALQQDLWHLHERLWSSSSKRQAVYDFFKFWRSLVYKLMTSSSLPLKLFGWESVNELMEASAEYRPPPRQFVVSGAGCTFCNGIYDFAGPVTADGYAQPKGEISYTRTIPADDPSEQGGHKLTLFRCTMRSQQKWWFLSEADEEQPGTDRDIDYYQHKSSSKEAQLEEVYPPAGGWVTCRSAGMDPPPSLAPRGVLVPSGQERNTLEHLLAKWAIEHEIVEQVLGDSTIHREVVARSTVLIKFLAQMCNRDDGITAAGAERSDETMDDASAEVTKSENVEPNKYCLQAHHLLFAWKTCTRKADTTVAAQVYQLLVQILPLCPPELALPLLNAVKASLEEESAELLQEVGEFCGALAGATTGKFSPLQPAVREEILNLLWAVLTHPQATSLKSFDSLQRYVHMELKVEPEGTRHRERFWQFCCRDLQKSSSVRNASINEVQAWLAVKSTAFVLEGCPRKQSKEWSSRDNGAFPRLMFDELTAYLERRRALGTFLGVCKGVLPLQHTTALEDRLRILRHIYGISDPHLVEEAGTTSLTTEMIEQLWKLCDSKDRESLIVFIADAATPKKQLLPVDSMQPGHASENILNPAFTPLVCRSIFLRLFCIANLADMGVGGYRSFHSLFLNVRQNSTAEERRTALDALWNLCLQSQISEVAQMVMRDMLNVYIQQTPETTDSDEEFGRRIFQFLEQVQQDLKSGVDGAEMRAERCLCVLNAALGPSPDGVLSGLSNSTPSTLARLARLETMDENALAQAQKCLPHGLRGQSACFQIFVTARRNPLTNATGHNTMGPKSNTGPAQTNNASTKFLLTVHPLETLTSVRQKVADQCICALTAVKALHVSGRQVRKKLDGTTANTNMSLTGVQDDIVLDELGFAQGCEVVMAIIDRQTTNTALSVPTNRRPPLDLSAVFFYNPTFANDLFAILLDLLRQLSHPEDIMQVDNSTGASPTSVTRQLVWDLLQSMPTNETILEAVKSVVSNAVPSQDAMEVEEGGTQSWEQLLDVSQRNRSIYVLTTIDNLIQPATEAISTLKNGPMEQEIIDNAKVFCRGFIGSGGFAAVVKFFSQEAPHLEHRRSNAVALRILKACLFSEEEGTNEQLLELFKVQSTKDGLLQSLSAMVVEDAGIPSTTILDVLRFLQILFDASNAAESFLRLPHNLAQRLVTSLLVREDDTKLLNPTNTALQSSVQVRTISSDMVLNTPFLADEALVWLMEAVEKVQVNSDSTKQLFSTLERLLSQGESGSTRTTVRTARTRAPSRAELDRLALIVCQKISMVPRPANESEAAEVSTSVLCGCLVIVRALVATTSDSGVLMGPGTNLLVASLAVPKWSETVLPGAGLTDGDRGVLDLLGVLFDGLLSPSDQSSVAICFGAESRKCAFDVLEALVRQGSGGLGYRALATKLKTLVGQCAASLRHRWSEFGQTENGRALSSQSRGSKYSGLRNQACTCYMNSALQQLFMMEELRDSMCTAPLPSHLRSSPSFKGAELLGKKLTLQWETGLSYEAMVEGWDPATGMHVIRYLPIHVATVSSQAQHHQVRPEDIARLPQILPDEFVLTVGRPGKETGVFEVIQDASVLETRQPGHPEPMEQDNPSQYKVEESEEERNSRHLLEEVQRTFIHLAEGSKGRCFDPRALVEACTCLKLEFDVWQQNDASEFVTKLLDRLEAALKKWAPTQFQYLDHTFGLKQTRQKICKECGTKTNKEEKLLSIDCQIRGKSDIHEALAAMTEADVMEGSNKVSCDRCKRKTDTILRTSISSLPNMLVLSLKRFDLDFNTFETVKLNSRCAFGEKLNMKPYTLEGIEAQEASAQASESKEPPDPSSMKTECDADPLKSLPDEDYEYRLAGVLVHAGVAQGGHYYSFIRDRSEGAHDKWFRFDDEDVTPFNPTSIETECFGGKVKKETKWPNGQVHAVEQEQYANALMLFYEKLKPSPAAGEVTPADAKVPMMGGYEAFKPDVRRTNATHKLQAFLFDAQFQNFLRSLLSLCCNSTVDDPMSTDSDWKGDLLQVLISYIFDVFLYASEKPSLADWKVLLADTLKKNPSYSRVFVQKLARKTGEVSGNWVRTFLMDCPDKPSREFAVSLFSSAFEACLRVRNEAGLLDKWTDAWKNMVETIEARQRSQNQIVQYPSTLADHWISLEDLSGIDNESASCIGIVLSFVNVLMDNLPRCWRYSAELSGFVRSLAIVRDGENGKKMFERALVQSLVPARLIALAGRERSNRFLQVTLPGAACPLEVANTQIRAESNLSPVVADLKNNNRGPGHYDYLVLLEALACLVQVPGGLHVSLFFELDDNAPVGLERISLTQSAVDTLTTIFHEHVSPNAPGMSQADIEAFLRRSGVESAAVSPQKINEFLQKYQATATPGGQYLSLEGFLAYYKDVVQSNESKVQMDLHAFGFRPDLTRRSRNARIVVVNDRETERKPAESVGIDVAESLTEPVDLGYVGNHAFGSTPQLFSLAFDVSEPLAEYLVAAAVYRKEPEHIINQTLVSIHRTPNDWNGNLVISAAARALMVIASVPDEHQEERISLMMLSKVTVSRNQEYGGGLLCVMRALHRTRQTHNYSNDYHWGFERYLNIFKDLRRVYAVYKWLGENKEKWSFLERELNAAGHHSQYPAPSHVRTDYPRDPDNVPLDHHSHTDSEMGPVQDSEDDEEGDSTFDRDEYSRNVNNGPYQIVIEGAGRRDVNGIYHQDGYLENACKYYRSGQWKGSQYRFFIFQCNVSNNTRHWYISIVPAGGNPGTSADIDFYTAPVTAESTQVPPCTGWAKGPEGSDPVPVLKHINRQDDGNVNQPQSSQQQQQENDPSWILTNEQDSVSRPPQQQQQQSSPQHTQAPGEMMNNGKADV